MALLAGAVLSLLPILALAAFAFPSADDYCYAVEVRQGFWRMQSSNYLSFTGRYTATFLLGLLVRFDLAGLYPWLCMATVVAMPLAFRALFGALRGSGPTGLPLTVAGAVAAAVFVGGLPSSVEAFLWMTSAVTYQWGIIAYVVWLGLLIRIARDAGSPAGRMRLRAVVAVVTVLLPGFNEVLAPIILVTIAGFVLASRRQTGTADRFMLALLGVAVVFAAVSVLAPGNVYRSSVYPDSPTRHNLEFAVAETARQTVRFLAGYGSYLPLWVAACAAWWWGSRLMPPAVTRPQASGWIGAWILGLIGLVYLTLFPLYWEYGDVNYTGEGRTYNVTYLVFCATVVSAVWIVLDRASRRWPALIARRTSRAAVDLVLAGTLALLMVVSPGTVQAVRALGLAPRYLEAQRARESILRAPENRGQALVVNTMRVRPLGLFWGDIQPEETHWINSCVATYYGPSSVRTPVQ